jgi:transposase
MSREIFADHSQVFLLPPSLEEWVPADHMVRFVRDFVKELDFGALGFGVGAQEMGRPTYSSELLLSAWLYGYLEKLRSSRKLEHACRTHLPLIWLLGMHYPDHNTLWRFYRSNREAIRKVFRHSVLVAQRLGLVGMLVHALDGTKIAVASASKHALHKSTLNEMLAAADDAIAAMESAIETEALEPDVSEALPEQLRQAHGRRAAIQAALAVLDEKGQKHAMPHEPDARMMQQGGGTVWAYNAQAVVDKAHGVVVAEAVTNQADDYGHLAPMLEQAEENTGGAAQFTLADAGYRSTKQELCVHERGHTVLMPEHGRETDNGGLYPKSEFDYDATSDTYTCPQGKTLVYTHTLPSVGNRVPARVYRCKQCKHCPVRHQCTRARHGRTIRRDEHEAFREQQRALRNQPKMRALLGQRKAIIEHLFGHIKENVGVRRWTAKGLDNARTQWSLLCLTVNLNKIYQTWKSNRAPDNTQPAKIYVQLKCCPA